ncbi:MAG: methyltransferase domain-containing protein [Syntrophales bacterium]|jgi:predicted SAM-dependent methyltransferase/tetratricopeptide (TPR) repeat protein
MSKTIASQTDDVKLLFQEGERFFNEDDMGNANKCFERIVAVDPSHYEALNNLGVILFREGHHQDAISYFHQALQIHAGYEDALENLAACLTSAGDFAEAANALEKILLSNGYKPETILSIIDCHLQAGAFSSVRAYLHRLAVLYGHQENIRDIAKKLAYDLRNALESGKYPLENIINYHINCGHLTTARDLLIPALRDNKDLENLKELLITKEKLQRLPIAILSAADLLEKNPERKLRWGDHWFSKELAEALSEAGAVITSKDPKVLIHLHGIPLNGLKETTHNIIWIHSHPDMVTTQSLSLYDHIFCLSPAFLQNIHDMGREGDLLIGGTAKTLQPVIDHFSHEIVFVANGKQGKGRKIIHDLLSLGEKWIDHLEVWGEGWDGILPKHCIHGIYFDNKKLPELYASSKVVLNDHHEDMRREGFLNPRILDVMASGGVVISDALSGAEELFGEALLTYTTPSELDRILHRLFEDQAYRRHMRELGIDAVKAYNFTNVAQKIIDHIVSIDEKELEKKAKNDYMKTVWAPVKGKLDTERIKRLKEVTAEQCEDKTLDVGCANGDSTAIMKRHNPSLVLTGLELTDWGYQEAVKSHADMTFIQGDAGKLPFPDQSFDTVVLDHIIEHENDPVPLILEAKRVARKRVVIGIPIMHLNDPDHKVAWRVDDFRNLLFGFFPRFSIRGMREPDGIEVQEVSKWDFVVGTGYLEKDNRKEITLPKTLALHLGCGQQHLKGFLNIDMIASPAVDLVCDSRRLPFAAGTVSRIETYHMIEHLPRHDFLEALFEWNRVLEEGGELIIECPDFDATIKEYIEGKTFRINNIFGLQRHPGDYHLFGYTFNDLEGILQGIGFREIRQEAPTDYHAQDEPSLRISAVKVHHMLRPADLRGFSIQYTHQKYAKAIEADRNLKMKGIISLPEGPIKLDICGGEFPYGNGFLNVDIRPLPHVDVVADITKGLHLADNTVDEILSCGTLEHFYIPTVIEVLKEMQRILKPGGKLTVGVPNLKTILGDFSQGEMDFLLFNQYIYGSVQEDGNRYNVHRSLWDADRMVTAMIQAGFVNVREQPYDLPFHIPRYMLKVVGIA